MLGADESHGRPAHRPRAVLAGSGCGARYRAALVTVRGSRRARGGDGERMGAEPRAPEDRPGAANQFGRPGGTNALVALIGGPHLTVLQGEGCAGGAEGERSKAR